LGLSEKYLNQLDIRYLYIYIFIYIYYVIFIIKMIINRFKDGYIPNISEFLSENWAMTLYHEWFGEFR
jgi:hypothetical protein